MRTMHTCGAVGRNIRERRRQLGLTQEELAFGVGTSPAHIRSIELGRANPTLRTLERISAYLQTDVEDLFVQIEDKEETMI